MDAVSSSSRVRELDCHVYTEPSAFAELAPVWDALLLASPDHSPWQSLAYCENWWRELGRHRLRIFVVRRGGEPCLIAPLQISVGSRAPGLGVRLLEPIAMLMDVNRPRLALGPLDPEAYACLFDAIWARSKEWDGICMDEKPWGDAELSLLRAEATRRECVVREGFSHLVPYLTLAASWQAYIATRSSKLRKNLKAARRKLEERGEVRLDEYSGETIDRGLDAMIELHARSWKRRKRVEHSSSPAYQRFYRSWIRSRAAFGGARVLVLRCAGNPVAATVAVLDGDTYYSAQIVHDEEYSACSPGTLLESLELEQLTQSGRFRRYDMLGSFLSNKMRWTDESQETCHFFVLRRTPRNVLLDGYFFWIKPYVRPWMLRLKERFGKPKR